LSAAQEQLTAILTQGAEALDISMPPDALTAFQTYFDLLESRGKNVNLTTVTGAQNVARLHFLDSISLLKIEAFSHKRVIDIGSGAGFPGIPLKIADPTITLTLLDSARKRITFLSDLCATLNLSADCVQGRAEDYVHQAGIRESFDIAVSRALARLNVLSELCLPYVKVGGIFLAMKSVDSDEELAEADTALEALGAKLDKCIDYTIFDTDIKHRAVVIKKISETPEKYPRRFARIQKSPL